MPGDPAAYGETPPLAQPDPLLQRAIPVSEHLPKYRTSTARRDLIAGVTVAALARSTVPV